MLHSPRKPLSHVIPPWVAQGARHFITIAAADRPTQPFANVTMARALLDALVCYDRLGRWYLWGATIMPDHLHLIATFDLRRGVDATIRAWRAYQTRTRHVEFQSRYFEHRLRDEAEFVEKYEYVRQNPVAKGLVGEADAWPFLWTTTMRNTTALGRDAFALPVEERTGKTHE